MPEEPEMVFTSPLAGMFNSLIPHVTARRHTHRLISGLVFVWSVSLGVALIVAGEKSFPPLCVLV